MNSKILESLCTLLMKLELSCNRSHVSYVSQALLVTTGSFEPHMTILSSRWEHWLMKMNGFCLYRSLGSISVCQPTACLVFGIFLMNCYVHIYHIHACLTSRWGWVLCSSSLFSSVRRFTHSLLAIKRPSCRWLRISWMRSGSYC